MRIIKFLETGVSPTDIKSALFFEFDQRYPQALRDVASHLTRIAVVISTSLWRYPQRPIKSTKHSRYNCKFLLKVFGDACNTLRILWYKFLPIKSLSTVLEQGHFCSASPVSLVTDLTNSQNHDDELRIWLAKRVAPPYSFFAEGSEDAVDDWDN